MAEDLQKIPFIGGFRRTVDEQRRVVLPTRYFSRAVRKTTIFLRPSLYENAILCLDRPSYIRPLFVEPNELSFRKKENFDADEAAIAAMTFQCDVGYSRRITIPHDLYAAIYRPERLNIIGFGDFFYLFSEVWGVPH